ncbi:MAG: Crp/Fnr family transcriptional regulator [Pirellulales bacterium]|nr:Crp/Fnr family transcriptional regulator [Pirellulales bacterium]
MADSSPIELLREINFFTGVADGHLNALAQLCRVVDFPSRTKIFEEFDRAQDVYFIVEGSVSLAICDASSCRQITMVSKGDLLGWSPLIGRSRLFDTARTETPLKTVVFRAEDLLKYCQQHTDFGFEFMRRAASVLGQRLSATRQQLLELSGVHLPQFPLESD